MQPPERAHAEDPPQGPSQHSGDLSAAALRRSQSAASRARVHSCHWDGDWEKGRARVSVPSSS